jgi:hypothetical protein
VFLVLARGKDDPTVTRSFRISARALKALEEEAESHNISVNTILNQQLLAFADFDRFFRRVGLIKIASATFQKLFDAVPDKEVAEIGRQTGGDIPKSIILTKVGSFDLGTVLSFLQSVSEHANTFEYGEVNSGGKTIITLLHRLGPKGSLFFSNYSKALFEQLGLFPKISTSNHSVTIELVPERDMTRNDSF